MALDPWTEFTGPAVKSFILNTGQSRGLPRFTAFDPEETRNQLASLGGTVRAKGGEPQAGVAVALKGTGFLTTTSPDGRFVLHGFPPGEYTLIAWPAAGKPKEKKVRTPVEAGADFDIEV
jgi:outer membrane usher protein FimD/PapC